MRPNAFPAQRRLKRRRLIRPLFERARPDVGRVRAGVVSLVYRTVERAETGVETPFQVMFVPGRSVRGVDRVRMRRRLREGFRLHQHGLAERFAARPDCLTLAVMFRGNPATAARDLPRDLPHALRRLSGREIPPPAGPSLDDGPTD